MKNFFQIFKKRKKKRIKLIFVMGNKMKCEFCAVFVHFKQNNKLFFPNNRKFCSHFGVVDETLQL